MVEETNFERLLQILAPGDRDMVAMMEAYFDESSSEDASTLLAVAGYLFTKEQSIALDYQWREMLADAELPYFRMSACAHGSKPFDKLDKAARDKIARRAIELIKGHMTCGFSAAIREKDYSEWLPERNVVGSPYVWCCRNSLHGVRKWADQNNFTGKIAYFFEAGHAKQSEANGVLNRIFRNDHLRAAFRYASHGFVDKADNRPVQTGDVLAWHTVQGYRRFLAGKPYRRDFQELLRDQNSLNRVILGRKEMFVTLARLSERISELGFDPSKPDGVPPWDGLEDDLK